jgi:hypothetical protein
MGLPPTESGTHTNKHACMHACTWFAWAKILAAQLHGVCDTTFLICRCRWEGRPHSPPFQWGADGEVIPAHDTWLMELDLMKEGASVLVDAESARDAAAVEEDLRVGRLSPQEG